MLTFFSLLRWSHAAGDEVKAWHCTIFGKVGKSRCMTALYSGAHSASPGAPAAWKAVCSTAAFNLLNKKKGEKKRKKKKKGAITLLSTFSQFPPALSPLSVVECQGWQGQHGWQGRGGGGQRGRVVHRVAPVGLHHRGLWGGAVRVRGAVLCAAAAAARTAAFVACNAGAKRWARTSQPVSRVHDAISPGPPPRPPLLHFTPEISAQDS